MGRCMVSRASLAIAMLARCSSSPRLTLLEQASAKEKDSLQQSILFEECFDPIHADPRFMALLKNVGLKK